MKDWLSVFFPTFRCAGGGGGGTFAGLAPELPVPVKAGKIWVDELEWLTWRERKGSGLVYWAVEDIPDWESLPRCA